MRVLKFFLPLLVIAAVFWTLFIPGPRGANDFPYASSTSVKEGFNLPQTWSSRGNGLGDYVVSTLWAWPIDVIYGLGARLNIDFSILERLIGILPTLIIGLWGIKKLLEYYGIKGWGNFVGTLVYLVNSYIILLIDGGQFVIGLSYAWLPIAYLTFIKSVEGNIRSRLLAALSVTALGFFDIRFIYVLAILLGLQFFYELLFVPVGKRKQLFVSWLKTGVLSLILIAGLNAYWVLPSLLAKAPLLPVSYIQVSQTSFLNFSSLGHSIFLLQPHWYKNVFGQVTPILPEFVLIPVLLFLAPLLRRKDKNVGFWLVVALISIFLVKGSNPPLGEVYQWLFLYAPGFNIFRDSTKFFFLIALSYSVLIGVASDEIIKRFPKFKFLYLLLITSYLLFLARPVWLNQMTGILSSQPNQKEYMAVSDILQKDNEFGRILWMPGRPPLGFASPIHPSVDALVLARERPYASLVTGTYELLNYLRNPFVPQLLDISGIGYISYPFPDTRREQLKQDNIDYYYWFLDKLENYSWATPVIKDGSVPLLKVGSHRDKFFVPASLFWANDSSGIYQELLKISNFRLANNAFVFVKDNPESIKRTTDFPSSLVWEKLSQKDKARFVSSKNTAKVTYQEISPIQYKVKIEGLIKPSVLAFSESYDSLWQADGKGSIPLYGLINGFPIERDGEYDIYFTPQKYVLPGLFVSGLTLLSLVLALLLLGKVPIS